MVQRQLAMIVSIVIPEEYLDDPCVLLNQTEGEDVNQTAPGLNALGAYKGKMNAFLLCREKGMKMQCFECG